MASKKAFEDRSYSSFDEAVRDVFPGIDSKELVDSCELRWEEVSPVVSLHAQLVGTASSSTIHARG